MALAVGMAMLAVLFTPILRRVYPDQPHLVPVLLVILGFRIIGAANSTPQTLLQRRLEFRRLMLLDVASSLAMTVVAPLLAWAGWGLWSLVIGEQGISIIVSALGLWTLRRVWKARLDFDGSVAKRYFRFGLFMMLNRQLSYWLDKFDEFWTGTVLGDAALGFYSKAYEFAGYPRRVVAKPLQDVFFSTYARLQHDRLRLSKTYYRVNSLVVRVGFLFSVGFILVAREFVVIFLGDKWLPMVFAFQLMVVYTLFDPLVVTAGRLATAVGHPEILTKINAAQLVIFVPLVVGLAHYFGIEGVAVAADIMLFFGVALIMHQMRRFVDFSLQRMFGVPVLALLLAAGSALGAARFLAPQSDWWRLIIKGGVVAVVYSGVLLALERNQYKRALRLIRDLLRGRAPFGGDAR
jgi:O-antigen/teichoic acid export membrane protein